MMQLSTPLTLLAMTWMSGTNARIGDGGHRNLVDYSKLKACDPNQNSSYTPECLSEGKGYTCTNVSLGSRNGDYRCLDRSQSNPTTAPTAPTTAPTSAADITEDECDVLTGKATGYSWCVSTSTCLAPGDDSCKEADCNNGSTGYSWCASTRTCLAPGDASCAIADCHTTSGSAWCFSTRECLPSTENCDPKYCKVDSDCNVPSTCNVVLGGKYQCH